MKWFKSNCFDKSKIITKDNNITAEKQFALDAIQNNPDVEGSLAQRLASVSDEVTQQINSQIATINTLIQGLNTSITTANENIALLNVNKLDKSFIAPCAAAHNGYWGGRNLTNIYTVDEICRRIANGTFEDLYIGDYFDITISTEYTTSEVVRCILAHFDYYWMTGDTAFTKHHAVIVPKNCFTATAKMNETNTTEGGYQYSNMRQVIIPVYFTAIMKVLGNHLILYRDLITKDINATTPSMAGAGLTGASSDWMWSDVYSELMSEIQVYGSKVWSSSGYDTGIANGQLALFQHNPTALVCKLGGTDDVTASNRMWWWLKDVACSAYFADVSGHGHANYTSASGAGGVRPLFCIG